MVAGSPGLCRSPGCALDTLAPPMIDVAVFASCGRRWTAFYLIIAQHSTCSGPGRRKVGAARGDAKDVAEIYPTPLNQTVRYRERQSMVGLHQLVKQRRKIPSFHRRPVDD